MGFILIKNLKPKFMLKLPKKFLPANVLYVSQNIFFTFPLEVLFEESRALFLEKKLSFANAKKFDEILTKIRFHIPQKKMFVAKEELSAFNAIPIYFLENFSPEEFKLIMLAKQYEDFLPVVCENEKAKIAGFEKEVFTLNKNDKTNANLIKDLNINFATGNYSVKNYQNVFKMQGQKRLTKMLDSAYILSKFESDGFYAYLYDFFIGEKVSYLILENKTNVNQTCAFSYFMDLAQKKINYLYFKRNKNFVAIQNVFSTKIKYFNYTKSPQKIDYSMCKGLENSNLPCLKFRYNENFAPKQKKGYMFMYSKSIVPLKFYSLFKLQQASAEYLENVFNIDIFTKNEKFNEFFNEHIKQKALIELLQTGKTKIDIYKIDIGEITDKYKNGEISALSCYLSLKNLLMRENEKSFVFCPDFWPENFSFNIHYKKSIKQVSVTKKKASLPCLIIDGVKYYNHLEISKNNLLTDWTISIEC